MLARLVSKRFSTCALLLWGVAVVIAAPGCQTPGQLASRGKFVDRQICDIPLEMEAVTVHEPPWDEGERKEAPRAATIETALATFTNKVDPAFRFNLAEQAPRTDTLLSNPQNAGSSITQVACTTADCGCECSITRRRGELCEHCWWGCPGPYRHRCPPYSFKEDARAFLPLLRDDARALVNWNNTAILGAAAVTAIVLRQDADGQVREDTADNPNRWGKGGEVLGKFGDATYQVPVLLALYGYALHEDDPELHHFCSSLFSAYTLTGLSTVAIKGVVNSDRPSDDWNDGQFGFPSFHTSSSFAIAAVIDEYHGPKAGLPAYAMAGLIGWSRIDERDHDLSDVVFGAALGYVIGKAVSGRHLYGDSRVRIFPFTHPTEGSTGLMLEYPF